MSFVVPPTFITSSPQCSDTCVQADMNCVFQVGWAINPHMKIGEVDSALAVIQHRRFTSALRAAGAEVLELPFLHGEFDSVFTKDNAVLLDGEMGRIAMLARPSTPERALEQEFRRTALIEQGFDVVVEASAPLEGGDVVLVESKSKIFFGYGQRSSLSAAVELKEFSGCEVTALELVDPYFFHLDTALNFVEVSGRQVAFAYRGAFSESGWRNLICDSDVSAVVEVDREDALKFACNWVEVNGTIIIGCESPKVIQQLIALGKKVVITPLDQFQFAGGSAACLVAKLHLTDLVLIDSAAKAQDEILSIVQLDS